MAKDMAVNISGLEDVAYEKAMQRAIPDILAHVADKERDELNRLAPSRKVNFQEHRTGNREHSVYSTHPGAQAMSTGAFIRPKRGQVLRFEKHGEVIYTRKPIRTKGNGYVKRALSKRRKYVTEAVDKFLGTSLTKGRR